ncbi:MAG: DUF3540 domain-containing protein [Deltaproteobacteria bacterium]|nr:DUF3540 domain-containing protein [Deltaproteobacteria bacterium]
MAVATQGSAALAARGDSSAERLPDLAPGYLRVRFEDGAATLTATGVLELAAPHGRLRLLAGRGLDVQAGRTLRLHAARRIDLAVGDADAPRVQLRIDPRALQLVAPRAALRATRCALAVERLDTTARALSLFARRLRLEVSELERSARRLVVRAGDAVRTVEQQIESAVGRCRTLVREDYALRAERIHTSSREQIRIDGKQVLVG